MKNALGSQKAQFKETLDLVVAYVKQETLGSLRPLGRYVAFGLGGALFVTLGFVLLLLGILRLLQTETGTTFHAHLSWLPYLITFVVGVMMVVFAFSRALRKRARS